MGSCYCMRVFCLAIKMFKKIACHGYGSGMMVYCSSAR